MNSRDVAHERKESFGQEVKEHGLSIREVERILLTAQRIKYRGKPRSKFYLGK